VGGSTKPVETASVRHPSSSITTSPAHNRGSLQIGVTSGMGKQTALQQRYFQHNRRQFRSRCTEHNRKDFHDRPDSSGSDYRYALARGHQRDRPRRIAARDRRHLNCTHNLMTVLKFGLLASHPQYANPSGRYRKQTRISTVLD